MQSWLPPTPTEVERAVALLTKVEHYRYFFDKLENPEWLVPLKKRGYFKNPPPLIRQEAEGTISFLIWPESRYLARMAEYKPKEVLEIILQLPETENVRVHADLADAAVKMPPDLAVRLIDKAKEWAKSLYQTYLWDKLGKLIIHLAKGGFTNEALDLAQILLEVQPDPRSEEAENDLMLRAALEPRARLSDWEYGEFLQHFYPKVLSSAGTRALSLLCDLTESYLSLKNPEEQKPEDFSYIWRPAIEEHHQNFQHGLKDLLVTAIRDSAEILVKENQVAARELVDMFEQRQWWIFQRLALHIIKVFWDAVPHLGADRLLNKELFENSYCKHEYALLVREHFNKLNDEQKYTILGWIAEGPDLSNFKEIIEGRSGKRSTDKDVERYKKNWQRDRLSWLRLHFTEDLKQKYEALVAEVGETSDLAEFYSCHKGWVGPTSPKTSEELQKLSVSGIIDFLGSWKPSGKRMESSPEGLGRVLASVISQNPARFADEAEKFKGLDPTYVNALVTGLRDALNQNLPFNWDPVLDLCIWAVNEPREIPGRENTDGMFANPHWGWARKSISRLLSKGYDSDVDAIHFEKREMVWNILYPITDDPDPTPEDNTRAANDPTFVCINSTRGNAMEAVVRYALWVARNIKAQPNGEEKLSRGFEEMLEVREVLEAHLNKKYDPSLAIHSVYGQWFPWLVLLDSTWINRNLIKIFSPTEAQQDYYKTAWNAYITFSRPDNRVFDILQEQYSKAIETLASQTEDRKQPLDTDERLADHLMIFYWWGKLNPNDPDGMFAKFWQKAYAKLRGHAFVFIGRNLYYTKETVSPEDLMRFRELWGTRFTVAQAAPSISDYTAELSAFGWWFASGKFDDSWAIAQLIEAVKLGGKSDIEHLVLERLVIIAPDMPLQVIKCLEAMVRKDPQGWAIYNWKDEARQILTETLKSIDPDVVKASVNFVNYLGSRGFLEFRGLLS